MDLIICAATESEWMPACTSINEQKIALDPSLNVRFVRTGVGMLASAISLTRLVCTEKPDLIIQAGIAGCFNQALELGEVVVVNEEIAGDTGVQENGLWKDLFDLGLQKENDSPFLHKTLPNPWLDKLNLLNLKTVNAITVNQISTDTERIRQLQEKYKATLESMEGAALHYIGRTMQIPFIQIRSVSNAIGERDKSKWKMKESIDQLNQTILNYVHLLPGILPLPQ